MKKLLLITPASVFILLAFVRIVEAQYVQKNPREINYKEVLREVDYPQSCREKGIVIVSLKISEHGEVTSYEFKRFPCNDLKLAVEKSLSEFRFRPAGDEQGQATPGRLYLPVTFRLTI